MFAFFHSSYGGESVSNFGRTGLIENPSAYTIKDGHLTLGLSHVYPYTRVFINLGFLPRLEIGGTVTQIESIRFSEGVWKNYGKYKDKAFFLKYQLLPETSYYPAISVGYDDFHGTKLFESKYIVATKYLETPIPQIVTLGYSKGKLNGIFGGTEVLIHPKLSFLAEYSPLKTEELKGFYGHRLKNSEKINYGISFRPYQWFQSNVFVERNKKIGFNLSITAPMGKGLPHLPKHFILSQEDVKEIKEGDQVKFYEKALKRLDLDHEKVYIEQSTLIIEYNNNGYLYESVALKKALDILKVTYFPNVSKVKVILKYKNIPITSYEFEGYSVNEYIKGKIDFTYLIKNSNYEISPMYESAKKIFIDKPYFDLNIKFRTFLNDPSGAFKYQFSVDTSVYQQFSDSVFLSSTISLPIYNNISSSNEPLMSNPVRSDVAEYLKQNKLRVYNLSINYFDNIFKNTFVGISVGYNEMMFAGIGGDILHFFKDGRIAVGIGGDYVKKRDPYKVLGFKDYWLYDYYVSGYYHFKYPEVLVNVKAGRFLAGDKGVRLEVSRNINGFEVGFWYTKSDTSDFIGENKNYSDKGVFIRIPLRIFKLKDTNQIASFSLAPWTRDVGQLSGRPVDVYQTVKSKMPFFIQDNAEAQE
ncbi:YjbH domain-containing protein [Sulfurihydrogenibium sp.]|uniref:YjbH domain-containing protein n=1 Tax=Sulfurihydrogenibium sp. TaxID=2053621 RepID=UPI00261B495C|nr:YjbH domain-containing protein [Sulfurihydrogenibium sp.]